MRLGFPTNGDRPTFSAPADGAALARGAAVTFAWTPVPVASAYGVEFTGADRHFSNPNGTTPPPRIRSTASAAPAAASSPRRRA